MNIKMNKTIILLPLMAALGITGCDSAAEKEAKYMQRGDEYFAAENYEKARIEYKNALQINPKDAEGYFAIGKTLEKINDFRGAKYSSQSAIT